MMPSGTATAVASRSDASSASCASAPWVLSRINVAKARAAMQVNSAACARRRARRRAGCLSSDRSLLRIIGCSFDGSVQGAFGTGWLSWSSHLSVASVPSKRPLLASRYGCGRSGCSGHADCGSRPQSLHVWSYLDYTEDERMRLSSRMRFSQDHAGTHAAVRRAACRRVRDEVR